MNKKLKQTGRELKKCAVAFDISSEDFLKETRFSIFPLAGLYMLKVPVLSFLILSSVVHLHCLLTASSLHKTKPR